MAEIKNCHFVYKEISLVIWNYIIACKKGLTWVLNDPTKVDMP